MAETLIPYALPNGEIVNCQYSATRGAFTIDFTLAGGQIVPAFITLQGIALARIARAAELDPWSDFDPRRI